MTEYSFPWDGNSASAGTGDCGPYSSDDFSDKYAPYFSNDATTEFVVPLYANKLSVASTAAATVGIQTGAAMVHGHWYELSASTTYAVPAVVGQTTLYRIVLDCDWTAQTVRIGRIGSTATCPALTQTDAASWENSLALVAVTEGSAVTVTDERGYLHFNTMINNDNLDTGAVGIGKIATGAVGASNIENRTRKHILQPNMMWNVTDSASMVTVWENGPYNIASDHDIAVYGEWVIPQDYSSAMTVKALLETAASGNVVNAACIWTAATDGSETAANSVHTLANIAEALAANKLTPCASVSVASAAAGDLVTCKYLRLGATSATDTCASVMIYGWLFSYTADS